MKYQYESLADYYQATSDKWNKIAFELCDGSKKNLPKFAHALKRATSFKCMANNAKED
jgi:hypothetical protein